jgi:2-hydroxy-6-oxonona-2,4-dienedioate hydrolase
MSDTLTEAATSRTVQTARWKLHYHEAGTGHPLILLHGTGPGATGWSNFGPNIASLSRTFRVIAPDFPGWGRSDVFDCSGESRNGANAEAVRLLMDALDIDRAALVGNSMGGGATLQFQVAHPDRMTHAITMGAGLFMLPNLVTPTMLSEGLRQIIATYRDPSPDNFRRLIEVMVHDPAFATEGLADLRSRAALETRDHLANWLKWPMGHPGGPYGGTEAMLSGLARSTVPTLMIHGRDDRTVPLETSLRTAALIPNARTVILNRCGHWAQLEHQAEFDALVTHFVTNTPG